MRSWRAAPFKFAGLNPGRERMQILKAGVLYFAVVFGAGFILRPIRILWVAPRLGSRMAELLEMSIMLLIAIVAARLIVLKLAVPFTLSSRLGFAACGDLFE